MRQNLFSEAGVNPVEDPCQRYQDEEERTDRDYQYIPFSDQIFKHPSVMKFEHIVPQR